MLLSQGAEISRANIHVSELYAQLVNDTASSLSSVESEVELDERKISVNGKDEVSTDAKPPVENGVRNAKTCPKIANLMSEAVNGVNSTTAILPSGMTPAEESLHNLSAAITQRQQSENGPDSIESTGSSLPSLVDRISDAQSLVEKYRKMQQQKRYDCMLAITRPMKFVVGAAFLYQVQHNFQHKFEL